MSRQSDNRKAIVGLGMTGLSCARYLHALGEQFRVVDSREHPPGLEALKAIDPEIKVSLGAFEESQFEGIDTLIMSPGVDLQLPVIRRLRERGVKVSGDIDIFTRSVKAPIIAVTGSNAKSTVVTLLGEMAKEAGIDAAVAGNIGLPVLDLLAEPEKALYILEVSSFQLETTANMNARVSAILNLSLDHMDRYEDMQAYLQAKQRIFRASRIIVVNRDDRLTYPPEPPVPSESPGEMDAQIVSYGLDQPDGENFGVREVKGELTLCQGQTRLLAASDLKIAGRHNVSNALAALALGEAADIPMGAMLKALVNFRGLPHRCEWVAEIAGVGYYNDSKGTNVGATIAAIEGLADKGRIILIAGGQGKGAEFSALRDAVKRHVKTLILIGEDARLLASELTDCTEIVFADGMAEAVHHAYEQATADDVVLLSPACASFDMFNNYQHRGEVFSNAVRSLAS